MERADKAALRLTVGLGLAVLVAYGLALPIPFVVCVMSVLVLCKPGHDAFGSCGFVRRSVRMCSMRNATLWVTEESSFVVLRALAMLGGMVAILLVPHPPEHQPYLGSLAWGFVAYKVGLFAALRAFPTRLRTVLLASVCLDLVFVALFVWFGGGIESHFYLLFYLLVALVSAQFAPGIGLVTAAAAGGLRGGRVGPRRRGSLASLGCARGHVLPPGRVGRVSEPARADGAGQSRGT